MKQGVPNEREDDTKDKRKCKEPTGVNSTPEAKGYCNRDRSEERYRSDVEKCLEVDVTEIHCVDERLR
jgi:hypothetical protein